MIDTQSNNCSLVITNGGANLIMFPCVGFASKPLSRNARQIFQAVSLSSSSLITIAFSKPFPLTKLTMLLVSMYLLISALNNSPKSKAFWAKSSSFTTSKAAIATAAATGLPPKVLPWLPGLITFITLSFAKTALTGYAPPLNAFPKIKTSGFTSGVPEQFLSSQVQLPQVANNLPVRAIPVCTSSAINNTLYFSQSAFAFDR